MDKLTPQKLIDAGVQNVEQDGVRLFSIVDLKRNFPEYTVKLNFIRQVNGKAMAEFKYIEKLSGFELIALSSLKKK